MELRDRLGAEARTQGKTLAEFLGKLLDEYEWKRRWDELSAAIRKNPPDDEYFAEFARWSRLGPELPEEDWSDESSYPEEWRD